MNRAPSTNAPPSPPRSWMIDLWRALACLGVVLFHACQNLQGTHPVLLFVADMFGQNGPRLAIFFVISGFCLARSIERHSASGVGPLVFWRRRLARIYPVYWAALLLAILLALAASPFNGLAPRTAFPSSPLAWLADLSLTSLWLGIEPRLLVSWTLNYEIGFYVLVGSALFFGRTLPRLLFYVAVTLLSHAPISHDWFPLLDIWPQFACGLAACCALSPALPRPVRITAAAYPTILAIICFATADTRAAFAPVIALCVMACFSLEPRLPRPPAWMLVVGTASFSIYLIHVPFMSPLLNLIRRAVPTDGWIFVAGWCVHLVLAILAGLLFHQYIERPLARKKRARDEPRPGLEATAVTEDPSARSPA